MKKIVKIVKEIPSIDYEKEGNSIFIRIKPFLPIYGLVKYEWFGWIILKGVKASSKGELQKLLLKNLWQVETLYDEKKGKYFLLKRASSSERPTHFWFGVTQKLSYPKENLRTIMRGEAVRRKNPRGLPSMRKKGEVLEIKNIPRNIIITEEFDKTDYNLKTPLARQLIDYKKTRIVLTKENFQKDVEKKLPLLF